MKNNVKGITLVSMVITIIVMLILAGVSISMVVGENGVLTRASSSAIKTNLASVAEDFNLAVSDIEMQYEEAWADASSISAYKGIFVTNGKLDSVLKQSKVLTNSDFITPGLTKTQADIMGKTAPKVPIIKKTCYGANKDTDLVITKLTGAGDALSGLKDSDNKYYALYLSNGDTGKELGSDVFVAVCRNEEGIPILVDLGLVESAIDPESLVNGILIETDGVVGESPISPGKKGFAKLPETVTWLNNAMGLENKLNGDVVE